MKQSRLSLLAVTVLCAGSFSVSAAAHPGARAHIAECIRVIKQDWGFPYFKVDFMRFGLNQEFMRNKPAVKSIKAYDPTITDAERMRPGLQGEEIYLGVFNWSDTPKEYALAEFGRSEPVTLASRHSVILKYDGKHSFAQLCQKLQSR